MIDEVLSRLPDAKRSGEGWSARCPAHEDRHASLSIKEGDDGRVLLHCHAGCQIEDVVATMGLEWSDLFPDQGSSARGGEGGSIPSHKSATLQRSPECTVEALAERCQLPVAHLKSFGLTDTSYQSAPAVRIPYLDCEGTEIAVQFRVALENSGARDRFRWRANDKPTLYGWQSLSEARAAGFIVIPEGASDYWTLRYHGLPALALSCSSGWREEHADALLDLRDIYVIVEPDQGGQAVRASFMASKLRGQVRFIYMPSEIKDPNELHRQAPESFRTAFEQLMLSAVPAEAEQEREKSADAAAAWERCKYLALCPRILDCFAESLARQGVANEQKLCELLFLALVSRHLDRPVSIAVKGPSSGGKSFLVKKVLTYFPDTAYYVLSGMSEHNLAYGDEPLTHRHLVILEAAGMAGDLASYFVRSLLSEGFIRWATVEKTTDGLREKTVERQGPTGLVVTTTKASLHPENETRLLSLTVTDTPEQTRCVLRAIADESEEGPNDEVEEWQALQRWIDLEGEHRVTIPFAGALADLIPPVAIRLRRDFDTVLSLIRAHTILHQASRKCDRQGRVVATMDDYSVVRALVADLVADGVGATVSEATRETVEAVCALHIGGGEATGNKLVAARLGIDPSAVSRRLKVAARNGYVQNLETRPGRPSRWIPGDPMPENHELLPTAAALADHCTVAALTEGIQAPPPPVSEKVLV